MKKIIIISDRWDKESKFALGGTIYNALVKEVFDKEPEEISGQQSEEIRKRFSLIPQSTFKQKKELFTSGKYILGLAGNTSWELFGESRQKRKFQSKGDQIYFTLPSAYKCLIWRKYSDDVETLDEIAKLERQVSAMAQVSEGNMPIETGTEVKFVRTLEELDKLIEYCETTGYCFFDVETFPKQKGLTLKAEIKKHSIDFTKAQISVLGISFQPGSGYLIPLYHCESWFNVGDWIENFHFEVGEDAPLWKINEEIVTKYNGENVIPFTKEGGDLVTVVEWSENLRAFSENWEYCKENGIKDMIEEEIIPRLQKLFSNPNIKKIAHNLPFDDKMLRAIGIEIDGEKHDTMSIRHTIREDMPKDLKSLSAIYFPEFEGYGEDIDFANEPLASLGEYCVLDNDLGLRLYYILINQLRQQPILYRVYQSLEIPKLTVLPKAEFRGMDINREFLEESIEQVKEIHDKIFTELMAFPQVQKYFIWKRKQVANERLKELEEKREVWVEKKLKSFEDKLNKDLGCNIDFEAGDPGELVEDYKRQLVNAQVLKEKEEIKNLKAILKNLNAWVRLNETPFDDENFPYSQPRKWTSEIDRIKAGDHNLFDEINFNSDAQMGEIIYTSPVGLKVEMQEKRRQLKNKETGKKEWVTELYPSMNKDDLSYVEDKTGLIEKIQEYRLIDKIISQYLVGILNLLDDNDRIHSSFGTIRSQRLSSRNPNLQNIITRTKLESLKEVVGLIKMMFVPPSDDYLFFQMDLSQAELRFIAETWNIERMVRGYKNNEDMHVITSANDNRLTMEKFYEQQKEAIKQMRFQGKGSNFGLMYETSVKGFIRYVWTAYGIKYSLKEGKRRFENFYRLYRGVRGAHERQKKKGRRDGFVRTVFGSKRHLPYIESNNGGKRSHDERVAINSPIQGSSGQWMIFAWIVFESYLKILPYRIIVTNEVHDSALGPVHKEDYIPALKMLKLTMENPPMKQFWGWEFEKVEMKADCEIGSNWKQLKEIEI